MGASRTAVRLCVDNVAGTTTIDSCLVSADDAGHWTFRRHGITRRVGGAGRAGREVPGLFRHHGRTSTWLTIELPTPRLHRRHDRRDRRDRSPRTGPALRPPEPRSPEHGTRFGLRRNQPCGNGLPPSATLTAGWLAIREPSRHRSLRRRPRPPPRRLASASRGRSRSGSSTGRCSGSTCELARVVEDTRRDRG